MKALVLDVQNLTLQFGGLKAVSDFSISIPERVIFGLIGPNGAGKTTFFNLLTGVYQPDSGSIQAFNKNLRGLKPYQITRMGMARTFQNIRLFKELTVLQNVFIAMDHSSKHPSDSWLSCIFKTPSRIKNEAQKRSESMELLKIFDLHFQKEVLAKNLSYGDQRKLEIVRAMATGAKLLLLDEPAAGMNRQEVDFLMSTIQKIRDQFGIAILLIEHDMKLVMGICERVTVLDHGVKIAEGTPSHIQGNAQVIEAYLGKSEVAHV